VPTSWQFLQSSNKTYPLEVSPNVVWTFIPAVSASLKNAVFALYSFEKPAPAQKVHCYY